MNVLAGDIGGTKTLLQILAADHGSARSLYEQRFDSQSFRRFDDVVAQFRRDAPRDMTAGIGAVCLAAAGPVEQGPRGRQVKVTNLPWLIEEAAIATAFGVRARLINDFEAVGYGTETLEPSDTIVVQPGEPVPKGNRITLGAGTGLGYCQSIWTGDHYLVVPSEAGHTDFAPADAAQLELLAHLLRQRGHVSTEEVLSGSGLKLIFDYLQGTRGTPVAAGLQARIEAGDPAAAIAEFGRDGRDAVAVQALDMFIRIYGAVAGNLALTNLPRGGVYIAGGIAPKLADVLKDGRFVAAFCTKGKMSALMRRFPIHIVRDEKVGLKGAALIAGRL